jgi:hypothetical protein
MSNIVRISTTTDTIRDARMSVCAALVSGGPEAALAAVAAASVRLAHHVASGNLLWHPARRMLLQVSGNLKLPQHFGRKAVRIAIGAGPNLYHDLSFEMEKPAKEAA